MKNVYTVALYLGTNTVPSVRFFHDYEDASDHYNYMIDHVRLNKKYFKQHYSEATPILRTYELSNEEKE